MSPSKPKQSKNSPTVNQETKYLNANNICTIPLLEYLFHMHFSQNTTRKYCHF